jgi:choice-of-anchor C domain-containing protein
MKTRLLGLAAALAFLNAASPASAGVNILTNGSFELGTYPGGAFAELGAGATNISGWSIGGGGVDWIGSYWQPADGARSLDLNRLSAGSVSQTFSTVAGQKYNVSFYLSGNPDGGPALKTIQIAVNGILQEISYTTGANTRENMIWVPVSFSFFADSTTETLTFLSATTGFSGNAGFPGAFGPALDNAAVSAVPELSTWAMMLLGFAGIGFLAYRRTQKMKLASAQQS